MDKLSKGTLHYTKLGLVLLFFYLLWGDFVLTTVETLIPKILPLQLKELGGSNTTIALLVVMMPSLFNMFVNPYVSFQSDNLRTAWGRRIPYLLVVTPMITVLLIAMAFASEIGHAVNGLSVSRWFQASPNEIIIGTITALLVLFQLFNFCLQPIYYYLFIDVVPDAYMARFMAIFRIVGSLQGYFFNAFIYGNALTHTSEIYIGCALAYFVGFMMMCLRVKEGEYPPPVHSKMKPREALITYVKECYGHSHYLYFNFRNACASLAGIVSIYAVFVLRDEIGIPLSFIGKIEGWTSLISIILLYPMGVLCDRYNPVRVILPAMCILPPIGILAYLFLHNQDMYVVLALISLPVTTLIAACELPLGAVILPRDRYGQFGSANQIVIGIATIIGSIIAGRWMDWLTTNGTLVTNYRYLYLWSSGFQFLALLFMFLLYTSWRKHGGPDNFIQPSPWNDLPQKDRGAAPTPELVGN